jgi:hypothetical protein
MQYKLHAVGVTKENFTDRAYAFREDPSSDNWMLLDRAMKAHQAATMATNETLQWVLEPLESRDYVRRLVELYNDVQKGVEIACLAGSVRLIKSEAQEIRN